MRIRGSWALATALLVGCNPSPVDPAAIRNVLLISIDTCRADRLGCYGFGQRTTPNIDALAARGTLFLDAVAAVPLTLPSHATLLTGTVPPRHGVRDNIYYALGPEHTTLAELLRGRGFTTAAFVAASVMDSRFGLDQGFEHYDDRLLRAGEGRSIAERPADEISRGAIDWLERHHRGPFFLFLHYYDPHFPYAPPEPFASRLGEDPYAGEIAYADAAIGRVLERLKRLGAWDATLVVVAGDHGEMLGEHGESTHGYFIYRGALRVPLVFRLPGQREARRVSRPVGLVDVAPTVAGLLGLALPDGVRGRDLSPVLLGDPAPGGRAPELYCESTEPAKYGANPLFGLVTERWKYVETTRPELYDRLSDPGESRNLAREKPRVRDRLRERLQSILAASRPAVAPDAAIDAEARARLRALGYVTGAGPRVSGLDPRRDDPKDLLDFHRRHLAVGDLIAAAALDEARRLAASLVEERPGFVGGHLQLARIARDQGRLEQAAAHYERAAGLRPDRADIHNDLGAVLAAVGRADEAIAHYRRALETKSDYLEARNNLANALLRTGRVDQAVAHYRRALEQEPEAASTWLNLGLALEARGELAGASDSLGRAVELAPDDARARRELHRARARAGRPEAGAEGGDAPASDRP